jgi:hypothetical protein
MSLTVDLRVVLASMQAKAKEREWGVHIAGGALNLLKTIYFAISWNFQKNGQPVMRTTNEDPDITINMTQGSKRTQTQQSHELKSPQVQKSIGWILICSMDTFYLPKMTPILRIVQEGHCSHC